MAKRGRSNRIRRRRGGMGALSKLLYVLAAISAVFIAAVVFFRVDRVEVQGGGFYTAEEIVNVAAVEPGDNLFLVNKSTVARRMLTHLPYLDEITIIRQLPDVLHISVTECVPLAYFEHDGGYYIVDAKCKILARQDTQPELAPLTGVTPLSPAVGFKLSVEEQQQGRLAALAKLLAAMKGREMTEHITAIDVTNHAHIIIGYLGRIDIKFSAAGDYTYATKRAHRIIHDLLEPTDAGILDVTDDESETTSFIQFS